MSRNTNAYVNRRVSFMNAEREAHELQENGGHFAVNSNQQPNQQSGSLSQISAFVDAVKKEYADRFQMISDEIIQVIQHTINNDEVVQLLIADNTSAEHILDRVYELVRHILENEQEQEIRHLVEQLGHKSQQLDDISVNLEKCRSSLAEKEKKLNLYKSKLRDVSGKQSEQDKVKKNVKKYSSKVNDLHEKIEFLEKELAQREVQLKKRKRLDPELQSMKEQISQLSTTNSHQVQLLDSVTNEKISLQLEVESLKESLSKSETERLEIRGMYISLTEKVESLVRSDQEKSTNMDDMSGGIQFMKLRMKDLKTKLADEIKDHKSLQKSQKRKIKEMDKALELKVKQLGEANNLIMKCQQKMEKYKEKIEEEVRKREKIEKNSKRSVAEMEESLERERKSFNELQREFGKKLAERSEEAEKRIRETFEARITSLQREVQEKENMVQKNNLEYMINQQLNTVRKSLHPDQAERMMEVYENKLKQFQRDYISKIEHTQLIREVEHKFTVEKTEMKSRLEAENRTNLRELEERKNQEYNTSVSNVKEALKALESKLEEEKKASKKNVERFEAEKKKNLIMKDALDDAEQKRKMISIQLEECNSTISKLKSMLEEENRMRQTVQLQYEDTASESGLLRKKLEELKLHNDALDRVNQSNKLEINQLKDSLDEESDRMHHLMVEKKSLSNAIQDSESDKKKLIDCIHTVMNNFKFVSDRHLSHAKTSGSSSAVNIEELCSQLISNVMETKDGFSKTQMNLEEKARQSENTISQMRKKYERSIQVMKETFHKRVHSLKKEISIIKSSVEGAVNSVKLMFAKQIDLLVSKISDQHLHYQQRHLIARKQHENEIIEMERSFEQKFYEEQDKYKQIIAEHAQKLGQAQEVIREMKAEKVGLDQEMITFERKFDDLKKVLSITNEFVPMPVDVQNGLLSNQKGVFEKAYQKLKEVFDVQRTEYEQTKQRLTKDYANLKEDLGTFKRLNQDLTARCQKTEKDLIEARGKLEKLGTDYNTELNLLLEQFTSLEKRHQDEIDAIRNKSSSILQEMSIKFPEIRGTYEKKLKQIEEKLEDDRSKVDNLKRDRQKMQTELEDVKVKLDKAMKDNRKRQEEMENFSRTSIAKIHKNELTIEELTSKLKEEEKERIALLQENTRLEQLKNKDRQHIDYLTTLAVDRLSKSTNNASVLSVNNQQE